MAQYDLTLVDRTITPRMPWHDMTVGMVKHKENICECEANKIHRWDQPHVMWLDTLFSAGTF